MMLLAWIVVYVVLTAPLYDDLDRQHREKCWWEPVDRWKAERRERGR